MYAYKIIKLYVIFAELTNTITIYEKNYLIIIFNFF